MEQISFDNKHRKIANQKSKPMLYKHVRLRFDPVRNATALLSPEKVFWPDETGLSILKLCTGEHTINEVIHILAKDYEISPQDISHDIIEFIQNWSDQLLIKL